MKPFTPSAANTNEIRMTGILMIAAMSVAFASHALAVEPATGTRSVKKPILPAESSLVEGHISSTLWNDVGDDASYWIASQ